MLHDEKITQISSSHLKNKNRKICRAISVFI